jgi:Smr domain
MNSPWRFTKESVSGEPIEALDLHSYSAAMARAAIRNYMNSILVKPTLLESSPTKLIPDWTIIVGQGWHSSRDGPVLKDTVLNLLDLEYGIQAVVDDRNLGRVRISADVLRHFVTQRR